MPFCGRIYKSVNQSLPKKKKVKSVCPHFKIFSALKIKKYRNREIADTLLMRYLFKMFSNYVEILSVPCYDILLLNCII